MQSTAVNDWQSERMVVARDDATGLRVVIVIDSTTHGPALGGIRLRRYDSQAAAVAECHQLARAMTLKNALAETGYGGGKAIIAWSDDIVSREAIFRAFGNVVKGLDGRYIPASDIGTGTDDLAVVGSTGVDVAGGDTDTSVSTATGVHAAIKAAAQHAGLRTLSEVSICVQGAGKVGARLARLLVADGALVQVSDVDGVRAEQVARELGTGIVDPTRAVETECDMLAPCATGGVISAENVARLCCRVVVGAANNVVVDGSAANALAARGIVLVPDFVASAGGVIQVRAIRDGWTAERLEARLVGIADTVTKILIEAESSGRTPTEVAEIIADDKLGSASHETLE